MTVCHKDEMKLYEVYDISRNKFNELVFLIYHDKQWVYEKANHFTPYYITAEGFDCQEYVVDCY